MTWPNIASSSRVMLHCQISQFEFLQVLRGGLQSLVHSANFGAIALCNCAFDTSFAANDIRNGIRPILSCYTSLSTILEHLLACLPTNALHSTYRSNNATMLHSSTGIVVFSCNHINALVLHLALNMFHHIGHDSGCATDR